MAVVGEKTGPPPSNIEYNLIEITEHKNPDILSPHIGDSEGGGRGNIEQQLLFFCTMGDKIDSTDIRWVIDKLYDDLFFYRNQRENCKKWSVTIWLATLIALASGKIAIDINISLSLLIAPIIIFWIIEAIYAGITIIISEQIEAAEELFERGLNNRKELAKHLTMSGRSNFKFKHKIFALLKGAFFTETVFLFYILLIVSSITFCLLFQNQEIISSPEKDINQNTIQSQS